MTLSMRPIKMRTAAPRRLTERRLRLHRGSYARSRTRLRLLSEIPEGWRSFTSSDRAALKKSCTVSRHTFSQMITSEPAQSERAP